ncbi:hypothetical protein ACT7DE_03215 [Bacillus paranthracis]
MLTVLGISKKQLHRLIFTENMLIGILSIFFRHAVWTCLFAIFLISNSENYISTRTIFILANECFYFNNNCISQSLYRRIFIYTNADSYEKGGKPFKNE